VIIKTEFYAEMLEGGENIMINSELPDNKFGHTCFFELISPVDFTCSVEESWPSLENVGLHHCRADLT
jgi:hypothetical protein